MTKENTVLNMRGAVVEAIVADAVRRKPIEACGYLAGADGVVTSHVELTNVDASAEHFSLDPREQFAAVKQFRYQGLHLRAVYHSHPESPARPSAEDIRLAFDPSLLYVIVSLAQTEPVVKAFRIVDGLVAEVPVTIV